MVGIVVGVLVLAICVGFGVFLCLKKRQIDKFNQLSKRTRNTTSRTVSRKDLNSHASGRTSTKSLHQEAMEMGIFGTESELVFDHEDYD